METFAGSRGVVNPSFLCDSDVNLKDKNGKFTKSEEKLEEVEAEGPARDQWSSPVEFLLSCVAMSVGLGNVWRFPFTAYNNGGGAFLIPYIIVLLFIGKPLYYMEFIMGQFASFGCVKVWAIVPAFRGIGYGQVVATWCVVTYYVALMGISFFYLFASFTSVLPWGECPADVPRCIDRNTNISTLTIPLNETISSAEYYFNNEVLHRYQNGLDDGIFPPEWRLTLCLLLAWIVLFGILMQGVKSSGKAAYVTALFPYLVLFTLLIRGLTLDGAYNGVMFFITPQWEKLLSPKVWYAAVGQSFFSLSVGFGSIQMFSSYNNFRHNVYRDATIISVIDTLTSTLAGFTIFSILGHLAYKMGIDDIELVLKGGGSGLAFVSYPDVLSRFDFLPQLFAVLFFLMLLTLGIGSASALTGCIITSISDEFPNIKKIYVTFGVCSVGFLLGLFYVTPQGSFILDLIDFYGGTFVIYVLAILEVVAVQHIYGYSKFIRDIEFMLNRKTGLYWGICWKYFIPGMLLAIFVYNLILLEPLKSGSYVFGTGANLFGIFIIVLTLGNIPVCFLFTIKAMKNSSNTWGEAFKKSFQASEEWSPKDPSIKKEYLEYVKQYDLNQLEEIDNIIITVSKF